MSPLDPARLEQTAPQDPPPAPPARPQLYDPERNKKYGITTHEEIEAQYGNQQALAARVRQDRGRQHKKGFDDLSDRISAAVRVKVLKDSLVGTKRATETMIHLTGATAPTTQTQVHLANFGPWALPGIQLMMEQSLVEVEPRKGVTEFQMPSTQIIIEMGRAAAKKAGCWGVLDVLLIANATVETVDLPKNIGWKAKLSNPYPWWQDRGALTGSWNGFHLFTEVREPGPRQDLQPAWSLALARDDKGEPMIFRERAFVARLSDRVFASTGDALEQLKPHVKFVAAPQVETAGATEADGLPLADATGKRHLTLTEIAADAGVNPSALVERLRGRGYLNLQGEATSAALDAGITTIVNGGTQFCCDAIKNLLDQAATEGTEADQPSEQATPEGDVDQTVNIATIDQPMEPAALKVEVDQMDEMADGAATDQPGEQIVPGDTVDPVDQMENPADAAPRVTARRGTGMRRIIAQPKDRSVAAAEGNETSCREPEQGETLSGPVDAAALGKQTVEQLDGGIKALLDAETVIGRRTDEGEFVPHSADNRTLLDRITVIAQATAKARALLATLLTSIDTLIVNNQQLEAEAIELKSQIQEQQELIERLEGGSVQVFAFRPPPETEDGSATAASH